MAEAQSDAKMLEALKLLETDEKEIGLRKASILAFLNTRKQAQALEKQKASLQDEIAALKATIQADRDVFAKDVEAQHKAWDKEHADHDNEKAALVDTARKEIEGLKASIAKAKKQAADVEKESGQKVEAANQYLAGVLAGNQKTMEDLDKEIQAKRDQIARLDEEFRSIAARHGLGAAIGG